MQYKVNIGKNNKFHGLTRDLFEEGDEIVFHVPFVTDVNTNVTSKDVRLESLPNDSSDIKYRFIMPAHDVSVDISFSGGMTCMHQNEINEMTKMGKMFMMNMLDMQQSTATSPEDQESKFCPECGAVIPITAKFCGVCGRKCQ